MYFQIFLNYFCYFYCQRIYCNVKSFAHVLYVKCRNASLHTNVSWYLTLKTIHNTHNYLLSTGPNNSEYNFYSFFGINLKCKQCYEVIAPTICLFLPIANVTTSFIQPRILKYMCPKRNLNIRHFYIIA